MATEIIPGECPVCHELGEAGRLCRFCVLHHRYVAPRPGPAAVREAAPAPAALRLGDLEDQPPVVRLSLGWPVVDRLMGGGVVPGQVILLSGDPGAGKTQLVLRWLDALEPALFISAEMSLPMLAEYVARTGAGRQSHVTSATHLDEMLVMIRHVRPRIMALDSLQGAAGGSLANVAELVRIAVTLTSVAHELGAVLVLIAHVTKDGTRAGPETVAHVVDTVMHLRFGDDPDTRELAIGKNRMGPSGHLAALRLTGDGYA